MLICSTCSGQGTPSVSAISLSNGVQLRIETVFGRPTGQQVITAEMAPATGNSFYRVFRDQNGLAVYAYELLVERLEGANDFRLTVKPAGAGLERSFPRADGGKPTPTPSEDRQLTTLHSGDRVDLPIFEISGTGNAVVDGIELRVDSASPRARPGDTFRFAGLKISINQGLVSATASKAVIFGRYAMFYLPGRGAYFFSTDEPAGRAFVKAGWIDGSRMEFVLENQSFECVADEPILVGSDVGSGRGQVWVYHDRAYKPEGNWTRPLNSPEEVRAPAFFASAADSLHWWLR